MIIDNIHIRAKELGGDPLSPYRAFISVDGKDRVEIRSHNGCYCLHYPNGGEKKNAPIIDRLFSMAPPIPQNYPDKNPIAWTIIHIGEWLRAEKLVLDAFAEYPNDDIAAIALLPNGLPLDIYALRRDGHPDDVIRENIMADAHEYTHRCPGGGVVIVPRSDELVFPSWPEPVTPGPCEKVNECFPDLR